MKPKRFWTWIGIAALGTLALFRWADASGIVTSAYSVIENAGSALTMRQVLNFVNGGCADNATAKRTDCTISGGSGSGVTVFSGSSVTLLSTQYLAIGGGAAVSSTEANVEIESPTAATVSNLSVQLSAALGVGASAVFTWRDGGSSQALTCTISGSSATKCTDNSDSFTAAQGDELDIQVVTTGTPSAVTVVIATAFGTVATNNPAFTISNAASTGTTVNTLTKLTGAPSTAVITATSDTGGAVGITTAGAGTTGTATITTAGKLSCVFDGATTAGDYVQISSSTAGNCHDTGSASYPSSGGQVLGRTLSTNASGGTYTMDLFPSEIQPGSGGGGSFTSSPPYYYNGSTYYVASTGYAATKPSSSPSWINSVVPSTKGAGPNGDYIFVTPSGSGPFWETQSASASVEAEFANLPGNSGSSNVASYIWIYDSTNSTIWSWEVGAFGSSQVVNLDHWSYSGSGNPSFGAPSAGYTGFACQGGACHLKIAVSAGTASFQVSLNGGASLTTLTTESVGTIAQAGYGAYSNSGTQITDIYSLVVH